MSAVPPDRHAMKEALAVPPSGVAAPPPVVSITVLLLPPM